VSKGVHESFRLVIGLDEAFQKHRAMAKRKEVEGLVVKVRDVANVFANVKRVAAEHRIE
jgi:hypothetical protein